MQRSLHFSFEIYYHSNMCHFLWKTRQAHSKPTLLHWTHLLSLMGDTISQKNDRLSASRIRSLMLEVPEASISLSSPLHTCSDCFLYSQDDLRSSRLMESSTHTHTHTAMLAGGQLIHCIWTVYSAGRASQCLLFFSFHWLEANAFHTCSSTWLERNVAGT